jgi:hypothetical protein
MTFLDGVLPSPEERVRTSLTRELELRRKRLEEAAQFSPGDGYVYRGGADLALRHGKFYPGRLLPAQYMPHQGDLGHCFANAQNAANADPSLTYCEGYYTTGYGVPLAHAWCVAPDGEMLELTFPLQHLDRARSPETKMKFLPPEHWGYYGLTFDVRLVNDHDGKFGLPMLDRLTSELIHHSLEQHDPARYDNSRHDFPILKLPYDPNRTELT